MKNQSNNPKLDKIDKELNVLRIKLNESRCDSEKREAIRAIDKLLDDRLELMVIKRKPKFVKKDDF